MFLFNLFSSIFFNPDNIPGKQKGLFERISGLFKQPKPMEDEKPKTDHRTSSVSEATSRKKGDFKLITSLKPEDVSPQWKHLSDLDISEIAKEAHDEITSELAALMAETVDVTLLAAGLVNHITFTIQEGNNDRPVGGQKTGLFLDLCWEWVKAEGTIQKWDPAKRSQVETAITEIVTRFSAKIGKQIKDKLMSYVKP